MNKRLENLKRVCEGIDTDHFDMGKWLYIPGYRFNKVLESQNLRDEIIAGECGTSACVAGWCYLDPWFKNDGFNKRFQRMIFSYPYEPVEFLMTYFDLDEDTVNDLFFCEQDKDELLDKLCNI